MPRMEYWRGCTFVCSIFSASKLTTQSAERGEPSAKFQNAKRSAMAVEINGAWSEQASKVERGCNRGGLQGHPEDIVSSSGSEQGDLRTKGLLFFFLALSLARVHDTAGAHISEEIIRIILHDHFCLEALKVMIEYNEDCLLIRHNTVSYWKGN